MNSDSESEYEYCSDDDENCMGFLAKSPGKTVVPEDDLIYNMDCLTCPICFEQAEPGAALVLPCGHSFCVECFMHYVDAQAGEGRANNIQCPQLQCGKIVSKVILQDLCDQNTIQRLDHLSELAFVAGNVDYHHCPTPDCPNVLYWKAGNGSPIGDCFRCKMTSCLKCGARPFHHEKTCEECNKFQLTDESLLKCGIRVCRRCGEGVELASGCYKMKCRCGYRFCFVCGSENALCGHTPSHHGFTDNVTGRGDFTGLNESTSYT